MPCHCRDIAGSDAAEAVQIVQPKDTCAAVERLQLCPDAVEVEMAVDPAQQMLWSGVIIKAEVVEAAPEPPDILSFA